MRLAAASNVLLSLKNIKIESVCLNEMKDDWHVGHFSCHKNTVGYSYVVRKKMMDTCGLSGCFDMLWDVASYSDGFWLDGSFCCVCTCMLACVVSAVVFCQGTWAAAVCVLFFVFMVWDVWEWQMCLRFLSHRTEREYCSSFLKILPPSFIVSLCLLSFI